MDAPLLSNGQARNNANIAPVTNGNGIISRNQNYNPHIMVLQIFYLFSNFIKFLRISLFVNSNVEVCDSYCVNKSRQFVGVAKMVGPVDFNKSLKYWQQDKWIGYFPVKWHIVKDLPNSLLKHFTLENKENKPVTNSMDTQESRKQFILDDFDFCEDRQLRIQEKKAKQQQFQKRVWSSCSIIAF
ncbi:putative YTH domain-containing protein [Helianthus anomalus]